MSWKQTAVIVATILVVGIFLGEKPQATSTFSAPVGISATDDDVAWIVSDPIGGFPLVLRCERKGDTIACIKNRK